jgi:signal transduction histidine kinase
MAEDVAARAFEPFFTTKEVGRGSGLGLSQVYGFAQQSGGAAAVSSRLGEGTRVTVWLPQAAEGGQGERQLSSPTAEGRLA